MEENKKRKHCIDIIEIQESSEEEQHCELMERYVPKKRRENHPPDKPPNKDYAYIIDGKLTDNATDRFAMATISKALLERTRLIDSKEEHINSKPIGWVRSHAVEAIVNAVQQSSPIRPTTKSELIRKIGLGNTMTKEHFELSEYDVILFSLFHRNHWSMMVCYVQSAGLGHIYHYDSLYPIHLTYSVKVRDALCAVGLIPINTSLHSVSDYPIQENNFECGYNILLMVACICNMYTDNKEKKDMEGGVSVVPKHMFPKVTPECALNLSKVIFDFLGSSTRGEYPPETISEAQIDKLKRKEKVTYKKGGESLLSHYNFFRSKMIERNIQKRENQKREIITL